MNRPSWPQWAMLIAEAAATRSIDPFEKVGACILGHHNEVLGVGYNGTPSGIDLDFINERDKRRPYMSHAEASALRYVRPGQAKLIAVTLRPCSSCLVQIAMYGIREIYYKKEYARDEVSVDIAKKYGIVMEKI